MHIHVNPDPNSRPSRQTIPGGPEGGGGTEGGTEDFLESFTSGASEAAM